MERLQWRRDLTNGFIALTIEPVVTYLVPGMVYGPRLEFRLSPETPEPVTSGLRIAEQLIAT